MSDADKIAGLERQLERAVESMQGLVAMRSQLLTIKDSVHSECTVKLAEEMIDTNDMLTETAQKFVASLETDLRRARGS